MRTAIIVLLATSCVAGVAFAQDKPQEATTSTAVQVENKLTESVPKITDEKLPSGAKIYVAPISNGFDTYIVAGIQKKEVPVNITTDRSKADYELTGVSESDRAGWAKMLFMGSQQTNETASIKLVNVKTGNVVFAYSVNKTNSARGKQSAGEAVAKHIREKIENRYH